MWERRCGRHVHKYSAPGLMASARTGVSKGTWCRAAACGSVWHMCPDHPEIQARSGRVCATLLTLDPPLCSSCAFTAPCRGHKLTCSQCVDGLLRCFRSSFTAISAGTQQRLLGAIPAWSNPCLEQRQEACGRNTDISSSQEKGCHASLAVCALMMARCCLVGMVVPAGDASCGIPWAVQLAVVEVACNCHLRAACGW